MLSHQWKCACLKGAYDVDLCLFLGMPFTEAYWTVLQSALGTC